MNSMTGYGESRGILAHKLNIKVDVRSVNNRFLNLKMNLPEILGGYESDIEKLIRQYIQRGSINFSIRLVSDRTQRLTVNKALLKNYYQQLKSFQKSIGLNQEVSIAKLINMPGVMEPAIKSDCISHQEWSYISRVIKQALVKLTMMRQREGNRLKKSLQKNIVVINSLLKRIEKCSPSVLSVYEDSFRKKIQNILDSYSLHKNWVSKCGAGNRNQAGNNGLNNTYQHKSRSGEMDSLERSIAMEVALFAQKADINEEIKRLASHVVEFSDSLNQTDEIGKKLDFITQEMLREINTIGAKSNDTKITYAVISLKSEVEKIKEQVQNIE